MDSSKFTLSLAAILLIIAGIVVACNGEEPQPEIFPQEISFTKFSLVGDGCQWVSFESGKVIVINSTEELRNFIVCVDDGRFFQIDFSKYSFLLARGSAESAVFYIDIDFSKEAAKEYALNLKIHTDVSGVAQTWMIAGITPKITSGANIVLNTQELQDTYCTEVYLMGTRWRLLGIVDTETGALTAPVRATDFTISFEPTNMSGREYLFRADMRGLSPHSLWGNYEFDHNTCTYRFIRPFRSSGTFLSDGYPWLIYIGFRVSHFFTVSNTQPRIMLLHLRDDDNFLLKYKEIKNE